MTKIVPVSFSSAGRVYEFDAGDYDLKRGTCVIAETDRGLEFGEVALPPEERELEEGQEAPKKILRLATPEDKERHEENIEKEKEAFKICNKKIQNHELDMRLVGAEFTFDNRKLLFYFTAEGRVDFRSLVKDLASVFHTRIELRQFGVRDETKLLGGLGICGRELCCSTFLTDFAPVSIKMAKDQSLSLNPTKISGCCGRLMCCLRNEEETYEELNSKLPRKGDVVETPEGLEGDVSGINVLRQQVKVIVELDGDKEERVYGADEVVFKSHRRPKKQEKQEKQEKSEKVAATESPEEKDRSRDRRRGDKGDRSDKGGEKRSDRGDRKKNGSNQDSGRRNDNKKKKDGKNGRDNNHKSRPPRNRKDNRPRKDKRGGRDKGGSQGEKSDS
ncbi:MAG: stage 0 sporulation family protein [Eubacterium sp.]|nr:stage 0 sporulation family protein [Eubacterium sp.]